MVLVFILCIIIAISLLICMLLLSTLKLRVEHLQVSNISVDGKKAENRYHFVISLWLFKKIKWLWIRLDSRKIKNMYHKMKLQKIDWKKVEKDISIEDLEQFKKLSPKLSYLKLNAKLGVEDITITNILVFLACMLVSLGLPYLVEKYEKDKYYYEIVPVYINKNVYEIKFDCIIEIEMVHIINIIYYFLKKRREKSHEQRTSNRRSYGYSYE